MKKSYLLAIVVFAFLTAAMLSEAIPVKFTIKAIGVKETIIQNETVVENCALNEETNITECTNQTITTNITSTEPWTDSATVDIECGSVCTYPMPFFEGEDVKIEKYEIKSNLQDVMILFEGTKSKATTDANDKIRIEIVKKSNDIVIDRISPLTVKEGVSQINVFARNNGSSTISYFNVTIIGAGLIESYAETRDSLEPGELGIVPVAVNITGTGEKEVIVKISWPGDGKSYTLVSAAKLNVLAGEKPGAIINSTEVVARFNSDKELLRSYESEYAVKKSEGYLVSEIYDSIKDAREYVATIQLLVEEEKFSEAKNKLSLLELSLEDISNGLRNVLKSKQSFGEKLRNNALIISATVAAIVTVISFYERQKARLRHMKERIAMKKAGKKEAAKKTRKPKKPKPKTEIPMPEIEQLS